MKKTYSYQPFFEATLKLIRESYKTVRDIPDEVMKELQDQVKSFEYHFVFYEATDSFDLASSAGFDQNREANTFLASTVEDSGFTVSSYDFDESPSWTQVTVESSPYNWIFPGEYSFEVYKRKEFQEAYNRNDDDEEEEEDPTGQDLYPHLARGVTTPFAAVIKIGDVQYIKGYEDSESAYEFIAYMLNGNSDLSIYFKDGSAVHLFGDGGSNSNDFTLADNYENAPVKGEGQQFLFSEPEHQIREKSGSSSTFIELFEGLEDSYEKDAFALDVVGIR